MVTAFKIPSDFNSAKALTQQHLTPLELGTSSIHKTHFVLTFIPHIISEITHTRHSEKMGAPCVSPGLISRCVVESKRSISSLSGDDHPYNMCGLYSLKTTTGSLAWRLEKLNGPTWVEEPQHNIGNSYEFFRCLKMYANVRLFSVFLFVALSKEH